MNDAWPWNFKENMLNSRTVMTGHKCTFHSAMVYLHVNIITGQRREPENSEIHIQKYPWFLRCIFWKFQGRGGSWPPPSPLLDPRLKLYPFWVSLTSFDIILKVVVNFIRFLNWPVLSLQKSLFVAPAGYKASYMDHFFYSLAYKVQYSFRKTILHCSKNLIHQGG